MAILAAGLTDIGQKRSSNQDSIYLNSQDHLYLVADGMGGHQGGDVASALAAKLVPEYLLQQNRETDDLKGLMRSSIRFASTGILQHSIQKPELKGMGTTLTALYFHKDTVFISNVGDSRAYLFNNHQLFQLTKDHTLVQQKLDMGIYTRAQAHEDMMKNVLIRTVGYEKNVDVDVYTYKVARGDLFLACSDGLYGKVSDRDLCTILSKASQENFTKEALTQTAQELVALANKNGGNDNISVVLVAVT